MENLDEYMRYFKGLPLKEKQDICFKQLKMLATLSNEMCKSLDIENEILVNRELIDLNSDNYTEDDFAEAVIVLVNSIQDSLCDFNIGLDKIVASFGHDAGGQA